jgi:hypothetical protein
MSLELFGLKVNGRNEPRSISIAIGDWPANAGAVRRGVKGRAWRARRGV